MANRSKVAVLVIIAAFLGACGQSSNISMFRGSLSHSGVYQAPAKRTLPSLAWNFTADGAIATSVAISDGALYFGSQAGTFYALKKDTGAELWSFKTGKTINSSAAVDKDVVFFQCNDGFTYALNQKDGSLKWRTDTGPDLPVTGYDNLSSSPAVYKDAVFVGGNNGNLYALNAETGEPRWTVPAVGPFPVRSSPAVFEDTVFFTAGVSLFAFDPNTGAKKWEYNFMAVSRSSPAIGEGTVAFGDTLSNIRAVDLQTGKERWVFKIKYYWAVSSPAISNGTVYAAGDDFYLNALDIQTGKVKWQYKAKGETIWSSPAFVDGVIYFGDWNFSSELDENGKANWGYMHAVDANTGKELWKYKANEDIVASPVVDSDGSLYFGSMDGVMHALR